jgi:hypothetical protein
VETAKDPNKAFQYHEQKVEEFGEVPDRILSVKGMKRGALGGEESTLVSSRSIEK